jgi:ribosomal protein S27AE
MKENEFIRYFEDEYNEEYDNELECPRCGSNDLQNFGGCFICNECGLKENLI